MRLVPVQQLETADCCLKKFLWAVHVGPSWPRCLRPILECVGLKAASGSGSSCLVLRTLGDGTDGCMALDPATHMGEPG